MEKIRIWWKKGWVKFMVISFSLLLILFLFRNPLLRGFGSWLTGEDSMQQTDACFVLGGNSYERGLAAFDIYQKFPTQQFVATGGNYPYQILCLDTSMVEAALTHHFMLSLGVPDAQVDTLTQSHSTRDEAEEILHYCQEHQLKKVMIISSAFHMRRVRWVFEELFTDAGIEVLFHGASAMEYDSGNWWKNEEGLIMANNEMVKLFYYLLKY